MEFSEDHYLGLISRRYGVRAELGARVQVDVGMRQQRGSIVGAQNDIQLRVRLDGKSLVYSFTPAQLTFLDKRR